MAKQFTRRDFLEALFEGYYNLGGNFIMVKSAERPEVGGRISFFPNIESLSTARFPEHMHVLFGVCPREKMKPGKEFIRFVTCLWAGVDVGLDGYSGKTCPFKSVLQAEEAIRAFPLKPSITIRSGRGIHLYWLLQEVKEISDPRALEQILGRLNSHFGCQSPVAVDGMLRLPVTHNSRGNTPDGTCYIESLDTGIRYRGREFQVLDRLQPHTAELMHASPPTSPVTPQPPVQSAQTHHPHIEAETEVISEILEVMDEAESSIPAGGMDQLVDRIVAKLGRQLLDQFADKIADRVAEKSVEKIAQRILARIRTVR
jgi:hypothetical protein